MFLILRKYGYVSGSRSASNLRAGSEIHIKSDTLDTDQHPFADDKPKCIEYEPISALIQSFEPLFES
jgi:hypothetical protein